MIGWHQLFRGASCVCVALMVALAVDLAGARQAASAGLFAALAMLWLLGIAWSKRGQPHWPAMLVVACGAVVSVAMGGYLSLSNRPTFQWLGIAVGFVSVAALVALIQARRQRAAA